MANAATCVDMPNHHLAARLRHASPEHTRYNRWHIHMVTWLRASIETPLPSEFLRAQSCNLCGHLHGCQVSDIENSRKNIGAKNWTQTFFSPQTFRALPGYPGKIPGDPAKKVWFPWFRGTYRPFWPPPLHVERPPYPTGKYPDSNVWVRALFPCLKTAEKGAEWGLG